MTVDHPRIAAPTQRWRKAMFNIKENVSNTVFVSPLLTKKGSGIMRTLAFVIFCFVCSLATAEVELDKITKSKWIEVRSPHFIVITDASEKIGKAMVQDLENFRTFLSYMLKQSFIDNGPPLKILALKKEANFKALDLPEHWSGVFLRQWRQDIAIANIAEYTLRKNDADWGRHTLLHEYVHYVTSNLLTSPYYPRWYSEGRAEYYATFKFENADTISVGSMALIGRRKYDISHDLSTRNGVDIENLFKTVGIHGKGRTDELSRAEERKSRKDVAEFYARAMISFHYFLSSRETVSKLNEYIKLINQGKSPDFALEGAFHTSWDELNNSVNWYARSKKINMWKFKVGENGYEFPAIESQVTKLTSSRVITEIFSVVVQWGTNQNEELAKLMKYADSHGEKDVNLALAKIDWSRRSQSDVDEAIADAKARFPDDTNIQTIETNRKMSGVAMMLDVGHPSAVQDLNNVRSAYRKIIKADKFNRSAYYSLGTSYSRTDEDSPGLLKEASVALESARILGKRTSTLSKEMRIATLRQEPGKLLRLKHQMATLTDREWITHGYGRFVQEMLELRALGQTRGTVTEGSIQYSDGSSYQGGILDQLPHGRGTLTIYYGANLSGDFQAGRITGIAEFNASNGYQYQGEVKDSIISGKGKLRFPPESKTLRESGEFFMGQEHGHQRKEFRNGTVMEGNYRVGVPHGVITISTSDGKQIQREYYLGKMRFDVDEQLRFAGKADDEFLPNGKGVCYNKGIDSVFRCNFNHGKLKPLITKPRLEASFSQ